MGGVYRSIEPPNRMAFTWAWESDGVSGPESLVTIELTEIGDECEVRILHAELADDQSENHLIGWTSSLNKLAANLD